MKRSKCLTRAPRPKGSASAAPLHCPRGTGRTERIQKGVREILEDLTAFEKKMINVETVVEMVSTPWFRTFLIYDPRATLRQVTCPVLALFAEKDLQVPPRQNLPEMEKALKAGGNRDATLLELKRLNHLFQTCTTGSPAEYGTIEETISEAALDVITKWIQEHGK